MKIYVVQGASFTEDGDLSPYSRVFLTLEEAKQYLKEDYEQNSRWDVGTEDETVDEHAWISNDGMKWGSNGPNQTYCEIIEHEIEIKN